MAEPIAKTYCNSDAGIIRAVVGTGEINSGGGTYNGEFFPDVPAAYYALAYTGANFDGITSTWGTKGTIEIWVKFDGWGISNTTATDGNQHMFLIREESVAGVGFGILYFHHGEGLHFDFQDGAGYQRVTATTLSAAADTWHHFALTWDEDLGSNEMKIYHNGTKVAEGITLTTFSPVSRATAFGQRTAVNQSTGLEGWMAGFTHYNYAKTSFIDRYNLRSGMNDFPKGN